VTEVQEQRIRVLLLAAIDMEQVIEAARAIQREAEREASGGEPNHQLVRALEAALAVCYWRPFTNSSVGRLDPVADAPPDEREFVGLHLELKEKRDKAYAHTDLESGRTADVKEYVTKEGVSGGVVFGESWSPLPRGYLGSVIALAIIQRERFRAEAVQLQAELGWEQHSEER
jgi:hypothetical protein